MFKRVEGYNHGIYLRGTAVFGPTVVGTHIRPYVYTFTTTKLFVITPHGGQRHLVRLPFSVNSSTPL